MSPSPPLSPWALASVPSHCEQSVKAVLLSCAAGVYTALGFSFLQGLKKSVQRVFSELTESNLTVALSCLSIPKFSYKQGKSSYFCSHFFF